MQHFFPFFVPAPWVGFEAGDVKLTLPDGETVISILIYRYGHDVCTLRISHVKVDTKHNRQADT